MTIFLFPNRKANIHQYLQACSKIGMKESDLFEPPALFEEKNVNLVRGQFAVLTKGHQQYPRTRKAREDTQRLQRSSYGRRRQVKNKEFIHCFFSG